MMQSPSMMTRHIKDPHLTMYPCLPNLPDDSNHTLTKAAHIPPATTTMSNQRHTDNNSSKHSNPTQIVNNQQVFCSITNNTLTNTAPHSSFSSANAKLSSQPTTDRQIDLQPVPQPFQTRLTNRISLYVSSPAPKTLVTFPLALLETVCPTGEAR